ncbi:MAG: invasion protein CiaB [Campylobacteraceae bacterium]
MTNEKTLNDLKIIYNLIEQRAKEINSLYSILDDENNENFALFSELLDICKLENTKQNKIALLARVVNLREDSLVLTLEEAGFKEEEKAEILEKIYEKVSNFHTSLHVKLLNTIKEQNLLNEFYHELLFGVHKIGIALTKWQPKWNKHIIRDINSSLIKEYGSLEKALNMLEINDLLEKGDDGKLADRSYSVLEKIDGVYESKSYAEFFVNEVKEVVFKIESLVKKLQSLEDDIFNAKDAYINYLLALKNAFGAKTRLIFYWQEVDRTWMSIKTPIQIGHPLEYYEDHARKAVALEWDIRFSNPIKSDSNEVIKNIENMYKKLFLHVNKNLNTVYEKSIQNVYRTQLYIGRPFVYYAAQFNGLFSAQVVPNDEQVSHELGKKIFAYADNVLDSIKAKPFMKLSSEIFSKEFLKMERELIFKKPEIWHKVYAATTIGHEFGHILWMDEDTEALMNKSGAFKNIEEFKATTGGLVAFFQNTDKEILPFVINDTTKRAIGLISWMKTGEVEPYYCEALIHLSGLFESGILSFGEKLNIELSDENIQNLILWYKDIYAKLATHYLAKRDAKEFLDNFAVKKDGFYMPKDKMIARFVEYYFELYKAIGRDVDTSVSKKSYM